MTLILSVATPDAVLQVSDRKLVRLRADGTVERAMDDKNKAVVFCDRIAFAYTGLAELGPMRQRTDEWIAGVIAPAEGNSRHCKRWLRPLTPALPTRSSDDFR